ncbi:hypothetical protein RhiirA4_426011 [Rhizophagus irregularis]|uniref:Uncharacterized protein n=1 Tax=Rhizophagus irregularis TaxID=588596 RepID=A0A2I1H3H8_9GLOM|nr:hypothetical protein RhiirA4_426011 [Rhizophagus irregularis]
MPSDISDKENIENTFQTEEESTYPSNNNIIYRERKQLGVGLLKNELFVVKLYIDNTPQFWIKYGPNFQHAISSTKSASDVASNYEKGIYHQSDQVVLRNIELSVNETNHFQVNFGSENEVDKTHYLRYVVKAIDQGQISRDSYRDLAAADFHLPRGNCVSNERITITNHMNQLIRISIVDMSRCNELEEIAELNEPDIVNHEVAQEVINTIGIGIYHSAKDILCYIIPYLEKNKILKSTDPTIHLRISGDGRNVGYKIKHVMVTLMILNHKEKHHHADYHYTTILYPCKNGLEISGILWNFELHFSADWKFLAICFGLNGPTSKFFCPWCLFSKDLHGDLSKDWRIEKNMGQIATKHDAIKDRLWELVLAEIKECGFFNDLTRNVITKEMQWLKVPFYFWENKESHNWEYTSLMGDDKETVLKFFNIKLLFKPSHARLIQNLWDQFYQLYCALRNETTDPIQLKQQACDWLSLFLTPSQEDPTDPKTFVRGLYMPSQVTPYIHALVYHGWELLKKHQKWGLKSFSCFAVEKKKPQSSFNILP